jgi:hypothetical protein
MNPLQQRHYFEQVYATGRNYISSILRKLELRDRTQLAIWAVQNQNSQPEAGV